MQIVKFVRKPFTVEGVQVTEENFQEVIAWCDGIQDLTDDGKSFIRVKVHHPLTQRQTRAYYGDWILKTRRGFKVYMDAPFQQNFEEEKEFALDYNFIATPGNPAPGVFVRREDLETNPVDPIANIFSGGEADYIARPPVDERDAISGKR